MDFAKYISTAHSTYTEATPLITDLLITKGRLKGGWLYFPSGPAGLLHVKVLRGGHQVLPATPEEDIALDDCMVPLFLDLDVAYPPLLLQIYTWNLSTSAAHALTICFFLDPYKPPRDPWYRRFFQQPEEIDTDEL